MGPVAIFHEGGEGGGEVLTHFFFTEISLMWATPETISIKD